MPLAIGDDERRPAMRSRNQQFVRDEERAADVVSENSGRSLAEIGTALASPAG